MHYVPSLDEVIFVSICIAVIMVLRKNPPSQKKEVEPLDEIGQAVRKLYLAEFKFHHSKTGSVPHNKSTDPIRTSEMQSAVTTSDIARQQYYLECVELCERIAKLILGGAESTGSMDLDHWINHHWRKHKEDLPPYKFIEEARRYHEPNFTPASV